MKTVKVIVGKKLKTYAYPDMPKFLPEQVSDGAKLYNRKRHAIFSEPGTGKTLTAIRGLQIVNEYRVRTTGRTARVLVVVPSIAVRNWVVWLAAMRHPVGDADIQVIAAGKDEIDLYAKHVICTYGMLSRRTSKLADRLLKWSPDVVILDESDNLNGIDSVRTGVIYGDGHIAGLVTKARWVWCLTGTPIRRYADDLFPWLRSLHSDTLKAHDVMSKGKFLSKFCVTQLRKFPGMHIPKKVVVASQNMPLLHEIIYGEGLATRRLFKDVAEHMPRKKERDISIVFTPSQQLLELTHGALEKETEMDEHGEMPNITEPTMVVAQHLLGIEKVPSVVEYLEIVAAEQKQVGSKSTIVLFWHRDVGDLLADTMDELGYSVEVINGSTPSKAREVYEDAFNAGRLDFLFGQIAAMGVSLNLQHGGNRAVFAERSWSYAGNVQAFDRIFRLGQDSDVLIDYIISDSPLEEPKTRVLGRKRETMDQIVDGL